MPSVLNKTDKTQEALDPSKLILNHLDNKVRNLEKRKGKLDAYKSDSNAGKTLNADQQLAVTKYDNVIESLEIFKELQKTFTGIYLENAKALKKQAKKEQIERQQQELKRTGEILGFQKFLTVLSSKEVLDHFAEGINGAMKLSEEQLSLITSLSDLILPESTNLDFEEKQAVAGEHLYLLMEGRNKDVLGTTYKQIKELLSEIKDCPYFKFKPETEEICPEGGDTKVEEILIEEQPSPLPEQCQEEPAFEQNGEILNLNQVPIIMPTMPPVISVVPLQAQPLTEVLPVTGNFNFLQESQIEQNAHMDPAIIASHPMVPPNPSILGYSGPAAQYMQASNMSLESSKPSPEDCSSDAPQIQTKATSEIALVAGDYDPARPIPTQTFTNQNFAMPHSIIQTPLMGGLMGPLSHVIPVGIMAHQAAPNMAAVVSMAGSQIEMNQAPTSAQPLPEQIEKHYPPPVTKEDQDDNQQYKSDEVHQHANGRNYTNGNKSNSAPRQNGGSQRGGRGNTNGYSKNPRPNRGSQSGGYFSNYNSNREDFTGYNNNNNNNYRRGNSSRGSNRGSNRGGGPASSNNVRGGGPTRNLRTAQPVQQ